MKTEILYSRLKAIDPAYLDGLTELLRRQGHSAVLADIEDDTLFRASPDPASLPELYIVLGGDGSLIRAAHRAAVSGVPVLGINFGTVGCLAELEQSDTDGLRAVLAGDCSYDRRRLLTASVWRDGRTLYADIPVFNDVVVYHGSYTKLVDSRLLCDGTPVARYRSDGIVLTTPTGSTGYSLSAGGSVLSPEARVIGVTPICAHSFEVRPLIFPDTALLEVVCECRGNGQMQVSVDGFEDIPLQNGDRITVTGTDRTVALIRKGKQPDPGAFYRRSVRKIL